MGNAVFYLMFDAVIGGMFTIRMRTTKTKLINNEKSCCLAQGKYCRLGGVALLPAK